MEENSQTPAAPSQLYAVYAEIAGHTRPLLQLDMSFARLMDDVVVPYKGGESFFIDGAPVTASKLKRIKLLRLTAGYVRGRADFDMTLTRGDTQSQKFYGEQYTMRFEHLLRQHSEDVTAQIIKVYNQVIKPRLKDYLPKREELISSALKLFVEGVKALGS